MKHIPLVPLTSLGLLLASFAWSQEAVPMTSRNWFERVSDNIMQRHIEGVGLVIYGMDEKAGANLGTELSGNARTPRGLLNSLFDPVLRQVDQAHLRGEDFLLDRFVLVARLQNSLDVAETEPQAATYQWVRDGDAGSFWHVDAAVILDWYFGKNGLSLLEYAADGRAVHLRTGFSWEKMTAGGAALDVDIRELFVGIGFHPFPNTGGEFKSAQMQEMQIGFRIQEDVLNDTRQSGLVFNWQPFLTTFGNRLVLGGKMDFKKLLKFLPQIDDAKKPEPGKSNVEPTAPANIGQEPALPPYVYFKPNFTLDALFENAVRNRSADVSDYHIAFGFRLGGGAFNDKLRYSYALSGVEGLEDLGHPRIHQEFRLDYRLATNLPLDVTARYVRGQQAPSYVDEDRLILSVGMRF